MVGQLLILSYKYRLLWLKSLWYGLIKKRNIICPSMQKYKKESSIHAKTIYHKPWIVLLIILYLISSNFHKSYKSPPLLLFIYQVRKLKIRKNNYLTNRHREIQCQAQISYSDMSGSISGWFSSHCICSLGEGTLQKGKEYKIKKYDF